MKEIFTDAGIRIGEAAKLLQISRATLYRWIDGGSPNQKVLSDRTNRILAMITSATKAGKLPVKDVVGKARMKAILGALKS